MHPTLTRRRHLLVYLVVWLLFGAVLAAGFTPNADEWLVSLAVFVPASVAYALLCLSTWYLCHAFPLDSDAGAWRGLARGLAVHALVSVLASAAWGALTAAWARTLDAWAGPLEAAQALNDQGPTLFLVGLLLYWLVAAFHYLLIAAQSSREAVERALEMNLLAREAELKALRAQIDPHFIFNSLHSVSALTTTDPAAARRMCLLLADFLRETLRLGANHRISLAEEFALVDRFLAIEQVRLGPRLHVVREAGGDVDACLVPPLLLQPLVENAVVHGVAQLVEGGTIRMKARRDASLLTITLENPCDPDRQRSRGVGLGLELLRRRLTTQFGVVDAVHAVEDEGRYRVEVRLPAVTTA